MNKCRRERILMNANQEEVAVFSVWGIIWIIYDMNYTKRKKSNCTLTRRKLVTRAKRRRQKASCSRFFFSRNCKLKWQLQIQNKTNTNAKICKKNKVKYPIFIASALPYIFQLASPRVVLTPFLVSQTSVLFCFLIIKRR